MAFEATISINVPDLPNTSVWFLNAAAWKSYWTGATAIVDIDGAITDKYIPLPYNVALIPAVLNIDGVDYILTTQAQMNSLRGQLDTLDIAVQQMRTAMKAAGLITEAQ